MKTAVKVFLLGMVVYPMVCSAQTNGCDAKRSSIEKEIAYAQTHSNAKRVGRICLIYMKVFQYGWTRWKESQGGP